jgi:hypothetical protein
VISACIVTSPRLWAAPPVGGNHHSRYLTSQCEPTRISFDYSPWSLRSMQTMRDAATIAIAGLIIAIVGEPLHRQLALARLRGETSQE